MTLKYEKFHFRYVPVRSTLTPSLYTSKKPFLFFAHFKSFKKL
jgi:hypothetical protein